MSSLLSRAPGTTRQWSIRWVADSGGAVALIIVGVSTAVYAVANSWTSDQLALAALVVGALTLIVALFALGAAVLAAKYAYDQLMIVQEDQTTGASTLAPAPTSSTSRCKTRARCRHATS